MFIYDNWIELRVDFLVMACHFRPLPDDFYENQIKDYFDDDVRRAIMEMNSSYDALLKSKELKEEGNKLFKTKNYKLALNIYEKSMQFLCVSILQSENDAILMEDRAIVINLKIATYWLKLNEFELENVNAT